MKIINTETFEKLKIRPVDVRELKPEKDGLLLKTIDGREIVNIYNPNNRREISFMGFLDYDSMTWEYRTGTWTFLDDFVALDNRGRIACMQNLFDRQGSYSEKFTDIEEDLGVIPQPISLFDITEDTEDGLYYLTDDNIY